MLRKLMRNYGMILVLLGLCVLFSLLTLREQSPDSEAAADELIQQIEQYTANEGLIISVGAFNKESEQFAILINDKLQAASFTNTYLVNGIPRDLRILLDELKQSNLKPAIIITSGDVINWQVIELLPDFYPEFKNCRILVPETYYWPDFLKRSNLIAIVDRIVVIAVIALGMTMVIITGGFSIYQVPKSLTWLGQGTIAGIPNTVILLVMLYSIAHVFMSYTRTGRYIYAVGVNGEAARLSGVPVKYIIIFVYIVCGIAAGIGGTIQASQLNTGTPNMGLMYELYVIAAVVVGGTSLSGGSGKILGTLIGVFVISVIQNGMNLLGMESYSQQVVLGLVILIAVLLDKARSGIFLKNLTGRKETND